MSEIKTAEDQKLDVLFQKAYLPVFIDKLAELGVSITSEDELGEVLKIAALTRMHSEAEVEAEVAKPSAIKQAAASLEAMTMGGQNTVAALLQDPEIASVFAG